MSSAIRDYRDLLVWQQAMELALSCEDVALRLPRDQWKLASQIRRAANSVHANIAEGNGSFSTANYLKRLSDSNGSLRELESHLFFVLRRYGEQPATVKARNQSRRVAMLLAGLVKSLRKRLKG
jgi:four helix bundle protein